MYKPFQSPHPSPAMWGSPGLTHSEPPGQMPGTQDSPPTLPPSLKVFRPASPETLPGLACASYGNLQKGPYSGFPSLCLLTDPSAAHHRVAWRGLRFLLGNCEFNKLACSVAVTS